MKSLKIFFIILAFVATTACSTYQADVAGSRAAIFAGDYSRAATLLEAKANEEGKDQLVYLLDYALMLHYAGRYKESTQAFLKADQIAAIKDYVSLSEEAGSLLTSDNLKQYKGEDFEKILIHVYLALNFLFENNYEDALVECRRVNDILYKFKYEAKRNYEQNVFARYLSALIWESEGKLDDAYIDYKNAHEIKPGYGYLGADLERLSKRLGRDEDYQDWKKEYGALDVPSRKEMKETGEVVLVFQQGNGPVKRPHPESPRFPKFYPRYSETKQARLEIVGTDQAEVAPALYSIQDVAIKNLDDQYAGLVAKKIAGIVAKEIAADQIRQKNELLGMIAWVGLHLSDQADLRHWSLLPESLNIARIRVKPGVYNVKAVGLFSNGNPSGEEKVFEGVKVTAGKKVFLNWRSLK